MPGQRKSLTGTVVSDKMDKTVIVLVQTTTRHRLYHKILKRTKRYQAHDDRFAAKPGDLVRIVETRPLSRHKRWRVSELVQRGEVAEIAPKEIDSGYLSMRRETQAPVPAPPRAAAVEEGAEAPGAEPAAESSVKAAPEEAAGEEPAAEASVEAAEGSVKAAPEEAEQP
jgi:small subunit ribosomal protein S17